MLAYSWKEEKQWKSGRLHNMPLDEKEILRYTAPPRLLEPPKFCIPFQLLSTASVDHLCLRMIPKFGTLFAITLSLVVALSVI